MTKPFIPSIHNYLNLFIFYFVISILYSFQAEAYSMDLKVGDPAPDFSLKDESGKLWQLSEFKGKKVTLYFYPRDNTPGCTSQACSFRDGYQQLQEAGIVVLGVSYDSPESHRKFKEQHHLPFALLSDQDKQVAKAYGAYGGWLWFLMPKRYTYLIDENGVVVHIFKKVDVNRQAEEVLEAFKNIGN
jgi:peroxiredoxin Q/BCP